MSEISYLKNWVAKQFAGQAFDLQPIVSGAGLRRYFRVAYADKTQMLMVVPPAAEVNLSDFVAVDKALANLRVRVPELYVSDLQQGLLLLEDFGDSLYEGALSTENADRLYQQALDELLKIQSCQLIPDYVLKDFLNPHFAIDMQLWREWCVERYWQRKLPVELFENLLTILRQAIIEQPVVCIHRDYHSRNLLVLADGSTGVIDFQSAMRGPLLYDITSLLRDCYVTWPSAKVQQWAEYFFARSSFVKGYTHEQLWRWFDLTGLQRHLKALGTFARKVIRDGANEYTSDIKRTLPYILNITARYDELQDFDKWLNPTTL